MKKLIGKEFNTINANQVKLEILSDGEILSEQEIQENKHVLARFLKVLGRYQQETTEILTCLKTDTKPMKFLRNNNKTAIHSSRSHHSVASKAEQDPIYTSFDKVSVAKSRLHETYVEKVQKRNNISLASL